MKLGRIPNFQEKSDQIEDYLHRFEIHATKAKWKKTEWSYYLSGYLTGKALEIYHDLTNKDNFVEYSILKKELLKKFQCTPEGFRKKFREAKPEQDESLEVFGSTLKRHLNRWINLSGFSDTKEGILNLILAEQLFESCSHDLTAFIREKNLTDFDEMLVQAENYRLARPEKPIARKTQKNVFSNSVEECEEQENAAAAFSPKFGQNHSNFNRGQNFRGGFRGGFRGRLPGNFRGRGQSLGIPQNYSSDQGFQTSPRKNYQNGSNRQNDLRNTFDDKYIFTTSEKCSLCFGFGHTPSQCLLRNSKNPCSVCGVGGHKRKDCPFIVCTENGTYKPAGSCDTIQTDAQVVCSVNEQPSGKLDLELGEVNGSKCSVLRDTGATICGVRKRHVLSSQYIPGKVACRTFGGEIHEYLKAKVKVTTPYYSGELICCVLENPVADIIIGNIPQVSPSVVHTNNATCSVSHYASVSTRAQTKKYDLPHKPLCEVVQDLNVSRYELIEFQKKDESLNNCFDHARSGDKKKVGDAQYYFYVKDDILYRSYENKRETFQQIVVPEKLRASVLSTAHDQLLAGHCGVRRTLNRVLSKFFWPGISTHVTKYVRTCDICQKTVSKGKVPPVPLASMPLIGIPFERIAIDLVGPISPPSDEGHTYILSVLDIATRYPETIPMKDISSAAIAEALLVVFSRMGFPKEILSDRGPQFRSDLMKQFQALCGSKGIHSSIYHPASNGNVERFHGTMKSMLKKVIVEQPRAWHRFLPALMFACRELPSESTGFSPFELMFGRKPRGPIALLADSWTDDKSVDSSGKPLYAYLFELKNIIRDSCEIAMQNSAESSKKSKFYFDKKAKPRYFSIDDEVLVLLPTSSNKLLMSWTGPYRVTECFHPDYRILVKGVTKVFHANMLKKYNRRQVDHANVGVILEEDESDSLPLPTMSLPMSPSMKDEDISMIDFDKELPKQEYDQLFAIYKEYDSILTSKPGGFSDNLFLEIPLTSDIPIRKKAYDLPFSSKQVVEREIKTMLELGVIEKSKSAFSSPVVLVKKPDESCRFCIDFRSLNKIIVYDAEPIPDVDELFTRISDSKYFTRIDLAKGYWQIYVNPLDRHKTAFATHLGLFQWVRMPFGLVNAPAVFARMMRFLVLEENSAMNFFDDILVHSRTFKDHTKHIRGVLEKLKKYNLTARPSKISTGYKSLEFLGHVVGKGLLKPDDKKIQKILAIPTPTTKKQVRSLLGLLSFYRRYIPQFSDLTTPISDLTKNPKIRSISWTPVCEEALRKIKQIFSMSPVLRLPKLDQMFYVQTDASSKGVGSVLLQEDDGILHPVCYASRKLLERERNYSTIERECLAIVWGISKFSKFLWGNEFVLQTDHRPLTFLNSSRFKNSRIMRWSLSLQEYRFQLEPVPGSQNIFADLLSRAEYDQFIP